MSLTLALTGNTSVLTADYFPPLELPQNYVCGLIDFQTYNSIPNIDKTNNLIHIGNRIIEIPIGSYEINDIAKYIEKELEKHDGKNKIMITANNNTLKSMIECTKKVFFNKEHSVGSLLGFSSRELTANTIHTSDLPVNINKVNAIRLECNIISGSYINNTKVHTLHEFAPRVGPGYKIIEVPQNVIYFPVNVKQLTSLTITLLDQDGDIIDFRGETITIRLHLKPQNASLQ